eukprot:m.161192 g.161192  ORF g.161192 m.161192 type:complete len:487 (-) comp9862_c0_seq7:260-1720(-)
MATSKYPAVWTASGYARIKMHLNALNQFMATKETSPLLHVQSPHPHHVHKVYLRRWLMLGIIVLLQISNAMIWICFSPIAQKVTNKYNISNLAVDFLSLCFMIASIPFGPVASWMLDTWGLRQALITGAAFNALGAWVRYAGDFTGWQLPLLFVGQILAATAQPVILDCPTMLAATWFGENERATANMIASVANPVGIALGSFFPPLIVDGPDDLRALYLYFALPATAGLLLSVLVLQNKPPTPPSASAESTDHDGFVDGLRSVAHNRAYLILMVAFGIGVGMFSAVSTLLGQIVNAQGYSDDDAGAFGAAMIGAGLVGAIISGLVVDKTKRFIEIVRICFPGATAGLVMFNIVNRPGQYWLVLTSSAVTGFFVFAALPVSLELCVECTYPVKEGTSAGFMWMMGQVTGIIFIFTMNALAGSANTFISGQTFPNGTYFANATVDSYDDMTNASWVAVAGGGLATILLMFFRSDYKRMLAEQAADNE